MPSWRIIHAVVFPWFGREIPVPGVWRSATARLPVPPDCPGRLARQVPVAMFPVAGMKAGTNSERRIRKKEV